eukprot:1159001-Pelagomonas_calceolata.AAC.8
MDKAFGRLQAKGRKAGGGLDLAQWDNRDVQAPEQPAGKRSVNDLSTAALFAGAQGRQDKFRFIHSGGAPGRWKTWYFDAGDWMQAPTSLTCAVQRPRAHHRMPLPACRMPLPQVWIEAASRCSLTH